MEVTVRYTDEVGAPFDEAFFSHIAEETLLRCPLPSLKKRASIALNVVAVSQQKIQELNKTYRQKDSVTDILSFGEYLDTQAFEKDTEEKVFLGEIFFCHDVIADAAREDDVTGDHEMIYVFSHGILHLLGYDHSDEMFAIQDAVTATIMAKQSKNIDKKNHETIT